MNFSKFFKENIINKSILILIVGYFLIELFYFSNPLGSFNNFSNKIQVADYLFVLIALVFFIKFFINKNKRDYFNLDIYELMPVLFLLCCILTSLFFIGDLPIGQLLKYFYLVSIFYVVRNIAIEPNNFKKIISYMFNILIIYLFILFLSYIHAVIIKSPNFFVLYYDNFPYINELYRLKGGYSPTSKLLAFHLFLSSIFILLFKDYLLNDNKKFFLLLLIFILSFLTFSRAGFIVCLLSIYIFLRFIKSKYLIFCFIPIMLLSTISLEIFSLVFLETNNINYLCEQTFQPKEINQRFGWFGQESQCNLNLDLNIYQDGYLILKLVGINAGFDSFLFGNGLGSYPQIWTNAATNNLIPTYFLQYVYPLAQSTPVTLFAENGIIGLLIFMTFIFGSIARHTSVFRNLDTFIFSFSLFFVILNLDIQNFRFLYFYLGIFYAYHYLNKRELI
tara:strand:- start:53 stop:1399 length:1347 start_codon:yes stop_codon:yes gene_type:complete